MGVSGLIWVLVVMASFTMGRVGPEEVGVLVNNLTHEHTIHSKQGTYIYNSITSDLILLDKREQTIEFTMDEHRGDRPTRDHIRVKTVDGSDVDVDVTVNYSIKPSHAVEILRDCGVEGNYKHWVRDYVRAYVRYALGEMTTEEFYDSENRKRKADEAQKKLNELLDERGIEINSVQVQHFEFYEAYQRKITEKKLADQEVEEEKSKKLAAEELQKTKRIAAEAARDIRIAEIEGELTKQRVDAEGQSARIRAEADAEFKKAEFQAKALLYAAEQKAQGIRAQRVAEAKGIEAFRKALSSAEGAKNLVMMEYARRLKQVQLSGSPISIAPDVERFEHRNRPAARGGK
jgi:regulator of protease activity HflC (stomatin/prohibitin superfamily)